MHRVGDGTRVACLRSERRHRAPGSAESWAVSQRLAHWRAAAHARAPFLRRPTRTRAALSLTYSGSMCRTSPISRMRCAGFFEPRAENGEILRRAAFALFRQAFTAIRWQDIGVQWTRIHGARLRLTVTRLHHLYSGSTCRNSYANGKNRQLCCRCCRCCPHSRGSHVHCGVSRE